MAKRGGEAEPSKKRKLEETEADTQRPKKGKQVEGAEKG
jgi:hypothetical protein